MSDASNATPVVVPVVANTPHALPAYGTPDSAGLDLRAKLDAPVVLQPGERALPQGFTLRCLGDTRPRFGLGAGWRTSTG